jgi:hypothetical protein
MAMHRCGFLRATIIVSVALTGGQLARAAQVARGTVYADQNGNGQRDDGEPGVANVAVSNQHEVVLTDAAGRYELPVTEDTILFVVKPSGYRVPLSANRLPRFFYIHKPGGSPPLHFAGVAPTGPLPESIDFPLIPADEPEDFTVVVFADTQPETSQEVLYVRDDVVHQLVGTSAAFGITVGDIMFDNLGFYEMYNQIVAQIGIPFYNVIGNHDLNFDAAGDADSDETFHRYFGPNYYSWNYGKVHFVALDTVKWMGKSVGRYIGALGKEQLDWLANDLAHVPPDRLIVLTMHIPLMTSQGHDVVDKNALLELLKDRPKVLAVAGHTHYHEHNFLDKQHGWHGDGIFHELISGTVSGSWWSGPKDERGVPIADMRDGTPNGYTMIDFTGADYTTRYQVAAGTPDDLMRIYPPGTTGRDARARKTVLVNVFDCSVKCVVECSLDGGAWATMTRVAVKDPFVEQMLEGVMRSGKPWASAVECQHMWAYEFPKPPKRGTHTVTIRVVDHFGREYARSKVF